MVLAGRVKDIDRMVLRVPFTSRCAEWNSLLVWRWSVVEVVRVETDAGVVGWGESLLHYGWSGGTTDDAVERVRGANAASFLGDDSVGAGLQIALYDVVGQALDVPAHALLPGPKVRDRCPLAWWNTKMPPQTLAAEAKDAVAAGYLAHKFKPRPWFDIYDQIEQVSAITPAEYSLDMDFNGMLLSAGHAAPVLAELDTYDRTAIYEAPIPQRDLAGYQQLRGKVRRPLAVHWHEQSFPTGTHANAVDGYVVSGGAHRVMHQATLCAEFNKNFWLQNVGLGLTTAFQAHLGAVLTHARWPAVTALNNYGHDLLREPLTITDGMVTVPDGPGLGVRFDESVIDRFRMRPPYDVPEPRHILTVTWPTGRQVHYTRMRQCWDDFLAGNQPVFGRGVTLQVHREADAPDPVAWADLHRRASKAPVYDKVAAA
ncbi:mandelate racemase/muconate lactonizing enzyme family protein [Phytoactinopolyspora limicola]|uniref:mandelate racemase/muconate lactonizing enzyme family protein n=1 Tax=Phytoactinopolyspora limicola TaxID=2715536 RepID=UPI001A9C2C79|nr:mandelate racemase/muconate lactonizing enzyme family protein [Phytoactinopolyspora limicola]